MSGTEAQRSTEPGFYCSCPGKVFLLGEYAVLGGLPALVAGVAPRFQLFVEKKNETGAITHSFANGSPAQLLIEVAKKVNPEFPSLKLDFSDPYKGAGGFGASTAQFALTYLALSRFNGWQGRWISAWKLYRELTAGASLPPSGADLVAQWQGGVGFIDAPDSHYLDVFPLFDWSTLLVFSAAKIPGRKIATHEHLVSLGKTGIPRELLISLEEILFQGISAVRENQVRDFGTALDRYADILSRYGFEAQGTAEDRIALRKLPGVLGVKGTGALQSDAMIVLLEPRSECRESVIEAAKARGLELISDGLTFEMGGTCRPNP